MLNRKMLAMAGVGAMMIGLVACGSKAESNIAESATPEPTAEATPTPEPTEEPSESHDFDLSVNEYKTESDTADCDSGTDIEELDTLYDWLYNNGVTRESVQNDRDSGCKNPYLDGYLEYLDGLVDKQIAEDNAGQVESTAKGDGLGGTEIIGGDEFILDSDGGGTVNGFYYDADSIAAIRKAAEGQAEREAADKARSEEMQKNAEIARAANNQEDINNFLDEIGLGHN